jgi:hypothetical protein
MAKKRRKPQNRSRNRPTGVTTRTAERPQPSAPGDVPRDGGSEPDGAERTEPKADPRPKRPASPSHRPATAPLRTRAEKKELARAEREAVRRQIARAQRRRQLVWIAGITIAVAAGVFFFTNRNDTSSTPPGALPGELTTEAPWPANGAKSAARATALGLPPEGTTMHEHANVQIFVHGKEERIPTDVGINPSAGTIQSIHTHDDTGLVHLESSESREFTLGDFFGVWGVRFTPSCLGAYCNEGDNRLQVFLDGEEVTDDLQDVQLDDQTVIVVTYGTPAELPDPIPSSFDFSSINP